MAQSDTKLAKVTINGKQAEVPPGTTIMDAASSIGVFIPRYCSHPALRNVGNCRICLVEVKGATELLASCVIPVVDGMEVFTESDRVKKARASVMEFLLINHPLDCPTCDKAGECLLQDYAYMYWQPWARFAEKREVQPVKKASEEIRLYTDRCILCGRCVRFLEEEAGQATLGFIKRGGHTELEPDPDTKLTNLLAGNIVDLCPVGALVLEEFLFKSRVWELESIKSVCPVCAIGCSTFVDVRENRILRIRPRENQDINGHWICDLGRFFFRELRAVKRLEEPLAGGRGKAAPVDWETALAAARDGLNAVRDKIGARAVAGMGSPYLTREDNRMLADLLRGPLGSDRLFLRESLRDRRHRFPCGFEISADRSPNLKGAMEALGVGADNGGFRGLIGAIETGEIRAAVLAPGYPAMTPSDHHLKSLAKLDFLVVVDIAAGPWGEIADVILPGAASFEKWGTFRAQGGAVQTVRPALAPPGKARPEWRVLADLAAVLGLKINLASALDIKLEKGASQ